ncbi:MAG TPA: CBS domain-containing protein [Candidatus Binatia bacterium]|jgi:acetoin utilization protein AcuB
MDSVPSTTKNTRLRVADVMTEVLITVTPSDSIGHAHQLMSAHGIRQLPVVEGRELVGVITDRDIRSATGNDLPLDSAAIAQALDTAVRDVMADEPATLSPHDDLQTVLRLFIEEKFGGIPVVDENAGLLGIITYIDLLRCFSNRLLED